MLASYHHYIHLYNIPKHNGFIERRSVFVFHKSCQLLKPNVILNIFFYLRWCQVS
ncbi:hypothetical protein Hanom_Chr14g01255391 [Helianthus anomalus]